jgi:Tol biopolymer transport system component
MTKSNKSTPKLTTTPKKRKRRGWLVLAVLAVLACAGWWAGTTFYHKLTFRPTRQIAFACWPERLSPHICVINADGTGRKQLIPSEFVGDSPTWSPDGTRIIFSGKSYSPTTGHSRHSTLFIINADGSGLVQLTDGLSDAGHPAWSPDGELIAFEYFDGNKRGVATIRADGSDVTYLTDSSEAEPAWSPNGTKIAFITFPQFSSQPGIYVMNTDGSFKSLLVDIPSSSLSWSFDGAQIAFTCGGICVINADGTGLTRLTNTKARSVAWSPDGQYIAYDKSDPFCFLCNISGQLWIMKADGSQQTRLTDGPIDGRPVWRPQP